MHFFAKSKLDSFMNELDSRQQMLPPAQPAHNAYGRFPKPIKTVKRYRKELKEDMLVEIITQPSFFNQQRTVTIIFDLTGRLKTNNVQISGMLLKAYDGSTFSARNISSQNIIYVSPKDLCRSLNEAATPKVILDFFSDDVESRFKISFRNRQILLHRLIDQAADIFRQYHEIHTPMGAFLIPHVVVLYNHQSRLSVLNELVPDEMLLGFLNAKIELPFGKIFHFLHNQFTFCEVRL